MGTIHLKRVSCAGKAVRGTITGTAHVLPTLENAEFIIPGGKYELKMTWSPRFKKMMPLVDGVKGRSGIRIHTGTIPEHIKSMMANFKMVSAKYYNRYGIYTVQAAEAFQLTDVKPLNFKQ